MSTTLSGLPDELRSGECFVAWRYEERGGKKTKVPVNPRTGKRASVTDPSTWSSLKEAIAGAARFKGSGVGRVVLAEDGYCGVDLDKCRNPQTGELTSLAMSILNALDSYAEITPSNCGVRVWIRATLPGPRCRKDDVELYTSGRYFTLTGNRLPNTPRTVEARQQELNEVYNTVFGEGAGTNGNTTTNEQPAASSLEDGELLRRAMAASNGAKFQALWSGDRTGYQSQSEADLALCCLLSFWTGRDGDRMDRLFRQSGLMRPKWDTRRGSETYGAWTIHRAIAASSEVYGERVHRNFGSGAEYSARPAEQPPETKDTTAAAEPIIFPRSAMTGSAGELAQALAEGTEVPEEFYFAAILTFIGALCAGRLRVSANVESAPRLYTVLLGASSDVKKSSALRRTIKALLPLLPDLVEILHGVGSAEGLARVLAEKHHVVLCYDELKSLADKSAIEGSALLALVASMYESNRWGNPIKDPKASIRVDDGHLSLVGCCTTDTYARMWTSEAISIGLPNRLFVVGADRKPKIAWPQEANQFKVDCLVAQIRKQLATLPRVLNIASEAKQKWQDWYFSLPASEHAKRLDTLGFRLMGLVSLTNNREEIDGATIDAVVEMLQYELRIRQITDPIDCDNHIARIEEKIRRALAVRGHLNHRDLLRYTNANRAGLWAFNQAIANVILARQIQFDNKKAVYSIVPETTQ